MAAVTRTLRQLHHRWQSRPMRLRIALGLGVALGLAALVGLVTWSAPLSSSVADPSPDHVTVIDGHGSVLAKGGNTLVDLATSLQHQHAVEQRLEQRVTEILERVVGPGRASVRVSAELDYAQSERTTETFDPDTVVVRSEQLSEAQDGARASPPATDIPERRANSTTAHASKPFSEESGSERRIEARTYEVGKTIRRELHPSGRLARLSVAVLVDGFTQTGPGGEPIHTPRSPEEIARLAALAKSAIGFRASRGDQIEVQSIPFETPVSPATPAEFHPSWASILEWTLPPMAILLVVVAIMLWLVRRRRALPAHTPSRLDRPSSIQELEISMANGRPLAPPAAGAGSNAPAKLSPPDPVRAAAVVRGWLKEE